MASKFRLHIVPLISLIIILIVLLSSFTPAVIAATGDETTPISISAIPTFECIGVTVDYSGDNNQNGTGVLQYRRLGGSWQTAPEMYVDRAERQYRGNIFWLTANTQYEIRVTFNDVDGGGTISTTTKTLNDNPTIGTSNIFVATNGSDTTGNGTITKPYKTIQKASDVSSPGSTILIRGGTYSEEVVLSVSGTSNGWITFMPYNNENVTITGNGTLGILFYGLQKNYMRFKNLNFRDSLYPAIYLSVSHDSIIENCTFLNNHTEYGIVHGDGYSSLYGSVSFKGNSLEIPLPERDNIICYNHLVQNCTFNWTTGGEGLSSGVGMYKAQYGIVVRNNIISSAGYQLWDGVSTFPEDEDGAENLLESCDFYGNKVYRAADDGLQVEGGDKNVRIWDNYIEDCDIGIATCPVLEGPAYIFRNVVWNASGRLDSKATKIGKQTTGYGRTYYYHNTFYLQDFNNGITQTNYGVGNIVSRNNIIYCGRYIIELTSSPVDPMDFDYDYLYSTDSVRYIKFGSSSGSSLESFQNNSGQELHGISVSYTGFYDGANGSLSLRSDSPCIDQGSILPGFNDVNSPWPYSANGPDIGAFEYAGGPATDTSPPYTTGHNPSQGSSSASPDTNIVVHIRDNGKGVDSSSIVMRVNGSTISPTITGTPYDYTVAYNPPADFDYGQVVTVTINSQDLNSPPNVMTQDSYSFTIKSEGTPPASGWPNLPFRINCAGSEYTDVSGNLWDADQTYTSGSWGAVGGSTLDDGTSLAIANTQDDRVYQTKRYGNFDYQFDLGNGVYDIYLQFAETYYNANGDRYFDVTIEGQLVLDNLDVYSEVGKNATLIKKFSSIAVTDGQLNIGFDKVKNNAFINGIKIVASGGNQPPSAQNDYYGIDPDNILSVPAPGVLGNDGDINGDSITTRLISSTDNGNLTLNANGSFIYTPDQGYTGTDAFSYCANDGQVNSNTAIVVISVVEGGGIGGEEEEETTKFTSVFNMVTSSGKFNVDVIAISYDENVEVFIPKDTVGTNNMGLRLMNIGIEKLTTKAPSPPDDAVIVGYVYDIVPDGAKFDQEVNISFKYEDYDIPEGVSEKNLVIATFDWATGKWQILPSTNHNTNNTVITHVEHFSTYAILAFTRPASFDVTQISTSSDFIAVGANLDIQALVVNSGDLTGSYEVKCVVDDVIIATELVTLDGGDNILLTFNTTPEITGTHTVKIGLAETSFTATEPNAPAKFSTSSIIISPTEIFLGKTVEISILVSNVGNLTGEYEAILKYDNEYIDSKTVGISGGDSEIIVFTLKPKTEGEHAVNIGDEIAFFLVKSVEYIDDVVIQKPDPEISRFDITPTYNLQTNKIESTRIDYFVENIEELGPDALLSFKVFHNGEVWEEIPIIILNQPGYDNAGSYSYIPSEGWGVGTYIFEAELKDQNGVVHSIQFEKFTLIEESITRAVSWGSLGIIIGGTLIVLLSVLAIVIYRRREMLRGYVE